MLFVAEYELQWEMLDAAIAKRLEWATAMPEGFRFVGEYVWQDGHPPFRGVVIFDADSVEAINSFTLHYGPTLKMQVHPASDVVSAIGGAALGSPRRAPRRRKGAATRRRKA